MKISIVTISFNQAKFVERTIRSVLDQGYKDLEYIVVDPGSKDGSLDIIEKYRDRISKLILEPDAGAADGLNKGFRHAQGDILGFLNSDDTLLPGSLDTVTLRKVLKFLGVEASDEQVEDTITANSAEKMRAKEKDSRKSIKPHSAIPFVRSASAGGWRGHFSEANLELFDSYAGSTLRMLGYESR